MATPCSDPVELLRGDYEARRQMLSLAFPVVEATGKDAVPSLYLHHQEVTFALNRAHRLLLKITSF